MHDTKVWFSISFTLHDIVQIKFAQNCYEELLANVFKADQNINSHGGQICWLLIRMLSTSANSIPLRYYQLFLDLNFIFRKGICVLLGGIGCFCCGFKVCSWVVYHFLDFSGTYALKNFRKMCWDKHVWMEYCFATCWNFFIIWIKGIAFTVLAW